MKLRLVFLSAVFLPAAHARMGDKASFDQHVRRLAGTCERSDDGGFKRTATLMNAITKAQGTMPGLNLYDYVDQGLPFPQCGSPGQNESFQGAALSTTVKSNDPGTIRRNKSDVPVATCVRVNICHGNAGFGWNRITVDRDAIGEGNGGNSAHTEFHHNYDGPKRPDYFPSTYSLPNPSGAGNSGAWIDENCVFHCPDGDVACEDAVKKGDADAAAAPPPPTDAPTVSPTSAPTASPTVAPTGPPTFAPTSSPTKELFEVGSTVTTDDGQTCVLTSDCTCETDDADDIEEDKIAAESGEPVPSGTKGDPHFIMWNGRHFDFHGGCDLVLVDAPDFNNGQGLKIHVRTKVMTWFSYVERAVVQIGNDRFEVKGGFTTRRFIHNGHSLPTRRLTKKNGPLPIQVGGNDVYYLTQRDHISWKVSIHLPDGQFISLRTIKDYMRVDIENPLPEYFASATGLMGSFDDDAMLARDGATLLEDAILYGQEWQVRNDEPSLFAEAEGPQYPQQCIMPEVDRSTKRLLAESDFTYEDAEKACAHLQPEERDDCIYDVIATNDMDLAGAY